MQRGVTEGSQVDDSNGSIASACTVMAYPTQHPAPALAGLHPFRPYRVRIISPCATIAYVPATNIPSPQTPWKFFFKPKTGAPVNALTIWLNGGPGWSSMEGFFRENGPVIRQTGTYGPVKNMFAWNNSTNMIWCVIHQFIDSEGEDDLPVGSTNLSERASQRVPSMSPTRRK